MKKMRYLIAIILFVQMNNVVAHRTKITDAAINKKVVIIKQMMIRHNYAVAGLTALGYIQQLSYWLPALISLSQSLFGESGANNSAQPLSVSLQVAEKKEERGFFKGLAQDTQHLLCTSDGWRDIGKAGLYLSGHIGAFFLFQKISETIDHPDTLRWYIGTYVPYHKTMKVIEKLAKRLEGNNFDNNKQKEYYEHIFYQSFKQLVGYGEDMCAYMTYKSTTLPDDQKMLAETTARYMMNYQNDIFDRMFTLITQDTQHYHDLIALVQKYKAELQYQRKIFASIEGEVEHDLEDETDFEE